MKSKVALGVSTTLAVVLMVALSGCAGKQCLPQDEEVVSVCRAEKACGGAGTAVGALFGGFSAGFSGSGKNPAMDNYNSCVDRNLDAQRFNAQNQTYSRLPATTYMAQPTDCAASCEDLASQGLLQAGLNAGDCIRITCGK